MSAIEVDDVLISSNDIIDVIDDLFFTYQLQSFRKTPPQIMIESKRQGLNAEDIAERVIARFDEIGIPTGPLNGKYPNVMENFVRTLIEEIVNAIQHDMIVDIATIPGGNVVSAGASPTGPVTTTGSLTTPLEGFGIAR